MAQTRQISSEEAERRQHRREAQRRQGLDPDEIERYGGQSVSYAYRPKDEYRHGTFRPVQAQRATHAEDLSASLGRLPAGQKLLLGAGVLATVLLAAGVLMPPRPPSGSTT